jgi:hypothetical protein
MESKIVILLGGSSFMGLTLLKKLEEKTYVLNRGKRYWDGLSFEILN